MQKNISFLNFDQFARSDLNANDLVDFKPQAVWALPQLDALISRAIKPLLPSTGVISPSRVLAGLKEKVTSGTLTFSDGKPISSKAFLGILYILNAAPRGMILGLKATQYRGDWTRYASNVPIILAALKQFDNVNYSRWDFSEPEMRCFLDKDHLDMSKYFGIALPYTREELLDFRDVSCLYRSGAKAGTSRNPLTTTMTSKIENDDFNELPRLVKVALTQLWVYSPSARHPLAITDLMNIDAAATPLIEEEVLSPVIVKKVATPSGSADIPWDI